MAAALCIAAPVRAEDFLCPGGTVLVQGGGERAEDICEAAAEARAQLASCNLPVTQAVTVEVTLGLSGGCYGLYHCDDDLIQLLPLSAYSGFLSGHPDSPFGHLDPEAFFNSVLRHELAHAALDVMPCPYDGCPATQEFVAYAMQIRFLSEAERAPFDRFATETGGPVTSDSLNVLVLMMSPETFLRNAHAYLSQQEDPCGLISEIVEGDVLFDIPFR
ncbi:hypothetical protein HKCCSP123_04710 [Rhodobacterales bacterium HKCCSP123]|nr:hypothetical protein [Rhodobacterales bacterium HKCCSP123]